MRKFKVGDWVVKRLPYGQLDLHIKPRQIEILSKYERTDVEEGLHVNFMDYIDSEMGWNSYNLAYPGSEFDWKLVSSVKRRLVTERLP